MQPTPAACMTLHEGILYGPIRSRRFGVSLGINLLPPGRKVCSLNCVYCQYSWTEPLRSFDGLAWPAVSEIEQRVQETLHEMKCTGAPLDRITIAGHGEPTLHPKFDEVVSALIRARDREMPGVPLSILSNSMTVQEPAVRRALGRLDERNMKLDAGRQREFRQVNASSVPIDQIIESLAALPDIAIQAMFVREDRGRIDNTTPDAVDAWLAALERIKPRGVQLYTIARSPALPSLLPVAVHELEAIAGRVTSLGLRAIVVG